MTYSFRIRFSRARQATINVSGKEWQLPELGFPQPAYIRAADGESIERAMNLVAISDGFASNDDARAAAERMKAMLLFALARNRIGIDFGERAPAGGFLEPGLRWVESEIGSTRVLNDVHGLMTFETEPQPKFARMNMSAYVGVSIQNIEPILLAANEAALALSQREFLAFELFNHAFFQPRNDSRLLLLIMAIEALAEPRSRPDASRKHAERLICRTRYNLRLSAEERDSMLGALRWLTLESIGQACRRTIAERLGVVQYGKENATKFFNRCYTLRSRLVHGSKYPTVAEIAAVVSDLELLVANVLTYKLGLRG